MPKSSKGQMYPLLAEILHQLQRFLTSRMVRCLPSPQHQAGRGDMVLHQRSGHQLQRLRWYMPGEMFTHICKSTKPRCCH